MAVFFLLLREIEHWSFWLAMHETKKTQRKKERKRSNWFLMYTNKEGFVHNVLKPHFWIVNVLFFYFFGHIYWGKLFYFSFFSLFTCFFYYKDCHFNIPLLSWKRTRLRWEKDDSLRVTLTSSNLSVSVDEEDLRCSFVLLGLLAQRVVLAEGAAVTD